jgi:hypothetical protein
MFLVARLFVGQKVIEDLCTGRLLSLFCPLQMIRPVDPHVTAAIDVKIRNETPPTALKTVSEPSVVSAMVL